MKLTVYFDSKDRCIGTSIHPVCPELKVSRVMDMHLDINRTYYGLTLSKVHDLSCEYQLGFQHLVKELVRLNEPNPCKRARKIELIYETLEWNKKI